MTRRRKIRSRLKKQFFYKYGRYPNSSQATELLEQFYKNNGNGDIDYCPDRSGSFNQNRHHNLAKSRGGQWLRKNIIWLKVDFHTHALHKEFDNSSLKEILEILNHLDFWLARWFKGKELKEVIEILSRLDRMKESQSDGNLNAQKYHERFTRKAKCNV